MPLIHKGIDFPKKELCISWSSSMWRLLRVLTWLCVRFHKSQVFFSHEFSPSSRGTVPRSLLKIHDQLNSKLFNFTHWFLLILFLQIYILPKGGSSKHTHKALTYTHHFLLRDWQGKKWTLPRGNLTVGLGFNPNPNHRCLQTKPPKNCNRSTT